MQSPYAHIDWDKAMKLFDQASPISHQRNGYPSVSQILGGLAKAADRGLMFVAHPTDPEIVHAIVEGRDPYDWRIHHIIKRLHKQRYVGIQEQKDGTVTIKLTKQGRIKALTYQLDTMSITRQKRWDRKWRVVIFDVPERYKRTRDIFRMRLKQLGLYALQESVYVSPYPCFDEIEFLRELYGIPFTVRYLLTERIEDDQFLHTHFYL